ncbi:MAG TPA: hypothetical protein ENN24_05800 [Bacteroidetes bacterium]|nr:hypothetical protein [Bacteroidota bacterium]
MTRTPLAGKFFRIFIGAILLLTLSSCLNSYQIEGTWVIMKEEMWLDGKLVNTVEGSGETIKFYHDSTGVDKQGNFTWSRENKTLTISDSGEDYAYTLRQKHKNSLTLKHVDFRKQGNNNDMIVIYLNRLTQ